jgi:hypothetical protein
MAIVILNKIMFILFFLSLVNVIRHSFLFLIKVSDQKKYLISNTSLFYLGLSLSMLLTTLFTGIKI